MEILNIDNVAVENITKTLQLEREKIQNKIMNNDVNFENAHIFENILSKTECEWIIYESEKYASKNGGWYKRRHQNYPTTDLPIRLLQNIYSFINNTIIFKVFPLIEKSFDLSLYFLNIEDLFIVKYELNGQTHLGKHKDGNLISFNILLNEKKDFEGGGTNIYFKNNNFFYEGKQGTILLHCGQKYHEGIKITNGVRYILVGFISYLKIDAKNN